MADNLNNDIRQDNTPAIGQTDLDTAEAASDLNSDTTAETDTSRTYQHDLDSDDDAIDPFMDEVTENPAEEIGIPEEEFKEELDKMGDMDMDIPDDDMREKIEDLDEDDDNPASASQ